MAKKRPFNRQFNELLILLILFCELTLFHSTNADIFSTFSKRNLLIKPKNLVKGFFKSFKPFQDFPSFQPDPITEEELLMQQAFSSPAKTLPFDSSIGTNGIAPISEYLVSNFARLNPADFKKFSNQQSNPFRKDQMSLSESISQSNVFYPPLTNNLLPSVQSPVNHNLMFDQSQNVQSTNLEDNDGDYPAPSQMVNSFHRPKEQSAGTSLSIGAAPGGGIGLKLGKFQMTFKRGNDGPQINLGTHDESGDQEAENSYVSMARSKDKKKGMNIKLGKAVQFSIGGNQDNQDTMKTGGSNNIKNTISLDTNRLKERMLSNRKSNSNLMSSASENNYDESPGIQMPAITIGGSGNGRPAITIGGGGDDEDGGNNYGARPQITIGGGDAAYPPPDNNNGGNNYNNNNGGQQSNDHWGEDHWNDHRKPRIHMKMPDMPQTYIEKNLKLPPIKLKINASPRVKITTGTKDPLEKGPIEEDPDMEDIFRPPEPFNVTTPDKDKDKNETDGMGNGLNGNMNMNNENDFINNKLNPNSQNNKIPNPYNDPNYQQYKLQNNYPPEQINFVSKYDEQQNYEKNYNKYQSYNYQTDYNVQNIQQTKYQYEDRAVGETKSINNNRLDPRKENLVRDSSNDMPVYNDQGYAKHPPIRQQPPNYNAYQIDNGNNYNRNNNNNNNYVNNNRYPIKQNMPQQPLRHLPEQNMNMNQYNQPPPPQQNYGPPQLPNQYNQPPAPFNGGAPPLPPMNHGPNQYNNNPYNNNHHRRPYEKTKEQIEEQNAIYLKSKDEYAEDRPQIILDMRPKISISQANATHPEEKKDPRHKNPFFKMIMNPEFVNHTTAAPEFDDDYNVPGYHKYYPNHYDFNKYKNYKPGKYGINYPKRTTTERPKVDKNRKSLTTTENPNLDADDADYYEDTTTMATTTTTLPSFTSDDNEATSTTKSTSEVSTKDPDDELENTTTASSATTTEKSGTSESSSKKPDDDDDDDDDEKLLKKLTTTGKPGEMTTTTQASSKPTSSTTQDPLNKKLTTSKPGKMATSTTSTTLSPEDYEDYDFGFLQGKGNATMKGKRRRKRPRVTTKLPSTDLDEPSTTESSEEETSTSTNDDDEKAANEKLVKKAQEKVKSESKDDYFTQMMNMLRAEKNPKKEQTTSLASTTTESSTKVTTESDDDDDDEDATLSTTTSKSKIKGRNQTDRSEALQFTTTEQSSSSSILSPKRSKAAKKATKPDKIAGINNNNISDYETEVTTITDKSMLLNLLRMVNDNMEVMKRMHAAATSTTPCPTAVSKIATTISSGSSSTVEPTTTTTTEKDEDDPLEDDDKKSEGTVSNESSSQSTTTAKEQVTTTTTEDDEKTSTTTEDDDDESSTTEESDSSSTTTNSPTSTSSTSTIPNSTSPSTNESSSQTTVGKSSETTTTPKDEDDEDDEDDSTKETVSMTSTEVTQILKNEKTGEKFGIRKTTLAKGTKTTNAMNMKTTSSFETKSEKMITVTSTESSFSISDSKDESDKKDQTSTTSKTINSNENEQQKTDEDSRILIDTQNLDDDLDAFGFNSSSLNQFDNTAETSNLDQSRSNEPIIVVLLPNEDNKSEI